MFGTLIVIAGMLLVVGFFLGLIYMDKAQTDDLIEARQRND